MKLSIVIPTFNEEANITSSLNKAITYLNGKDFQYEIIISDDGSKDKTKNIVKEFTNKYPFITLLENKHTGKAGAVRKGILSADGDIVLFTDADFATPIETIDTIVPLFEKGAEVVIGSRAKGKRDNEPFKRKIAGKAYNIIVQATLLNGIDDTQAGFKAFTRDAAQKIFTSLVRFSENQPVITKPNVTGFDIEVLFLAKKLGFKITSIPIQWSYIESKRVNIVRDSVKLFTDLMVIRINSVTGKYK